MREDFSEKCRKLGLDPNRIRIHQNRIKQALKGDRRTTFVVNDTCRLDNGGIVQSKCQTAGKGFVAFVPAAGASSRYYKSFSEFIKAMENKQFQDINSLLPDIESCALPDDVKAVIHMLKSKQELNIQTAKLAIDQFSRPKAFQPAVINGDSFLDFKLIEHAAFDQIVGQVFVAQKGKEELFSDRLSHEKDCHILVQGSDQSTIRFDSNGEPILTTSGDYSMVPAGHGTLSVLIPKVKEFFPDAHSVFIRNVDNVTGTGSDVVNATNGFLDFHYYLLHTVKSIRHCLDKNRLDEAAEFAAPLIEHSVSHEICSDSARFLRHLTRDSEKVLWEVLFKLFHFDAKTINGNVEQLMVDLYHRPVNTLGQVPNSGKDVGGTPVFAECDQGQIKICLELPHANEEDRKLFFEDPKKATHFNPVFAAAEIGFDATYYEDKDDLFWLLSAKTYEGKPVYYHETVLYELLGNSLLANCAFIEVPRYVFNPHKSYLDTRSRHRDDWIR